MKPLKIGTVVFIVNHSFIKVKQPGGKVLPARIIGYENINGTIFPMLKVPGYKYFPVTSSYTIFDKLEDAIKAITTKKTRQKK